MTAKNLGTQDNPFAVDPHLPAAVRTRLLALRDVALTLIQEVESINPDPMLDVKDGISLNGVIRQYEINLIKRALRLSKGSQLRASHLLGLKPTTLNAKIKRFNIGTFSQTRPIEKEGTNESNGHSA